MRRASPFPVEDGWSVYLLRCKDGTLYAGATNDLARRLGAHGRGRVKYTRGRLPVEVAYAEACADKSAALSREHALKRLSRREKLALAAAWQAARVVAEAGSTSARTRTRRSLSRRATPCQPAE